MSDTERLVQARIPSGVYERLSQIARDEGFRSMAAYLRAYLIRLDRELSERETSGK